MNDAEAQAIGWEYFGILAKYRLEDPEAMYDHLDGSVVIADHARWKVS